MNGIEKRTMDKVAWRLVPFLMLCYFIAYLDRVNIGFAGASMTDGLLKELLEDWLRFAGIGRVGIKRGRRGR